MNQQTETRLIILEKKLHRCQTLLISFASIIILLVLLSFKNDSPLQEILSVKALNIVDDHGRTIIELKQNKGLPEINALSASGKKSISLSASSEGVGNLFTFDSDGEVIYKLGSTKGGGGYMALYNSRMTPIFESGINVAEAGYLRINDRAGKNIFNCTQSSSGGGLISLSNDGIEEVNISSPSAGGRIAVFNSSKIRVGYIGTEDNKDGAVVTWKADGLRSGIMP